jgi:hypothetical protein
MLFYLSCVELFSKLEIIQIVLKQTWKTIKFLSLASYAIINWKHLLKFKEGWNVFDISVKIRWNSYDTWKYTVEMFVERKKIAKKVI